MKERASISYLERAIPAGRYPITIGVIRSEKYGVRITGGRLTIRDTKAVVYELAAGYRIEGEEKKQTFAGFPVETGTAAFCDKETAEKYWEFLKKWYAENPGKNLYDDYLAGFFQKSYEEYPHLQREGGDFIRWNVPGTEQEIVMLFIDPDILEKEEKQ